MRSVVALLRREVQAAFVSPVAYTILFGFLLICGWGFVYGVAEYSRTPAMMVEQRGWTIRTFLVGQRLTSWLMIAMILLLPGLSMRAFSEERKGGTIELRGQRRADGALHLCVADRGPGIPVDELERIFDPFVQSSTTKDGSGGTGLGLPISRRIVEMHGGQLYAANREGGGAEFHLILPATDSTTPGDGTLAAD